MIDNLKRVGFFNNRKKRSIRLLFPIALPFVVLIATPKLVSQTHPQFGGGGQIMIPTADFGGSVADFYSGVRYGQSVGIGINVKTRFDLEGVPLAATMEYSILRNKGMAELGEIELEHRIFSLKLGPEVFLTLGGPFTGYISANIALNNLGGDVTFKRISTLPDTAFIMRSGERLGFGLTSGVLVELYPAANLDISLNYNFINPLNHVWEDSNPDKDQRLDSYISINDAKDPEFSANDQKHFIPNARSIQTLQLTITLIFKI